MGVILFILGIVVLGSLLIFTDELKERKRQQNITEKAKSNIANKIYLEKRQCKRGLTLVKLEDFRWSYIQNNGLFLNDGQLYFSAEEFEHSTVIVGLVGKGYNIMDNTGHYILPTLTNKRQSYSIKRIIDGYYSVAIQTRKRSGILSEYYLYREDGARLNSIPFTAEVTYSDGWFIIKAGDKESRIDRNGNQEMPFFKFKKSVGNSLYIVGENSAYVFGLYDVQQQKMILPCKYEQLFYCDEFKTCFVRERTKEGVQKKGKCVIFPEFQYRIIDLAGNIIYELKEEFSCIVNGKFILTKKTAEGSAPLFGAILFDGTIIFKPIYKRVLVNDSGTLLFALSDMLCLVSNTSGKVISQYHFKPNILELYDTITIYKHIYPIQERFPDRPTLATKTIAVIICSPNGKKGILSLDNIVIVPAIYDSIKQINDENDMPVGVIVEKNGLFGALSLSGQEIIPVKHPSLSYEFENQESYIPLDNIVDSGDFYANMREHNHWQNWKSGRARFLIAEDKEGNIVHKLVINSKTFGDNKKEQ